jgi:hypothetical protein
LRARAADLTEPTGRQRRDDGNPYSSLGGPAEKHGKSQVDRRLHLSMKTVSGPEMQTMRRARVGLLMLLIPLSLGAATYALRDVAPVAAPAAPAEMTPTSGDSSEAESGKVESDDSHSHTPQHPKGEVIGVPLLA